MAAGNNPRREQSFPDDPLQEKGRDTTRILALSDGVFAVAMTLLVLNIKDLNIVNGPVTDSALSSELLGSWKAILSYAISFLIAGLYWRAHHRIFQYIERYDTSMIRINNILLLLIAFQPFPTSILGLGEGTRAAVVFYATCLMLTGLMMFALWWYVSYNHRLIRSDLDEQFIHYFNVRQLIGPVIFLLSMALIPVTIFEPNIPGPRLAEFSWILIAVTLTIHSSWYRRRITRSWNQLETKELQEDEQQLKETAQNLEVNPDEEKIRALQEESREEKVRKKVVEPDKEHDQIFQEKPAETKKLKQ